MSLLGKVLFILFIWFGYCYADMVILEKATGRLIEYQSADGNLDTMLKNANNMGYAESEVEITYISKAEWEVIREEQIDKPARERKEQIARERKQKAEIIKQKLNLTDKDLQDLKEALEGL